MEIRWTKTNKAGAVTVYANGLLAADICRYDDAGRADYYGVSVYYTDGVLGRMTEGVATHVDGYFQLHDSGTDLLSIYPDSVCGFKTAHAARAAAVRFVKRAIADAVEAMQTNINDTLTDIIETHPDYRRLTTIDPDAVSRRRDSGRDA